MFNIKTKLDTFQILGGEEFSKRTNARSWEGHTPPQCLFGLLLLSLATHGLTAMQAFTIFSEEFY